MERAEMNIEERIKDEELEIMLLMVLDEIIADQKDY
jgi:hypothetical protein